jgi:hypothetical protein
MECELLHFILWNLFSSQQVKITHSNCGTFRKQYLPRSEYLFITLCGVTFKGLKNIVIVDLFSLTVKSHHLFSQKFN